jgi:peptidoglycan/LPS O-acetylase OafA/YrhL
MRNETVDVLRAVAAIMVCLFHFTNGQHHFWEVSVLRPVGAFGWMGVEVFFVISGFIVPYSMARANYMLALWPRFMAKRLIRLEPPYLVSIGLVMLLGLAASATPGFRGQPIDWQLSQVAAHVGYLNAFLGLPWLNPVYWSLAVEFQFYVLVGLALPALSMGTPATRIGLVALLAALPLLLPTTKGGLVIPCLPFFAAGLFTFLLAQGLIQRWVYWSALLALAIYLFVVSGLALMLSAALPAAIIATVRLPRIGPIAWLGTISYSIYLLHVPVGGRVMNLASRLAPTPATEAAAVAIAFAASISAAYALYTLVERPARDLAGAVPYNKKPAPGVSSEHAFHTPRPHDKDRTTGERRFER